MAADHPTTKTCSRCKAEKPADDFYRDNSRASGLTPACRSCTSKAMSERWRKANPLRVVAEGTKWCRRCETAKPHAEFSAEPRHKDGLASYCRECCRGISRNWKATNSERHLAYVRAYQQANPDKVKIWEKNRKPRPIEVRRHQSRLWREANRLKVNELNRSWKKAKREKVNASARRLYASNTAKYLGKVHQRRVKILAGPGVKSEDLVRIRAAQRDRCAICRIPLKGRGEQDHITPICRGGIHAPKNVQFLCTPCNRRKAGKDQTSFMQERGLLL